MTRQIIWHESLKVNENEDLSVLSIVIANNLKKVFNTRDSYSSFWSLSCQDMNYKIIKNYITQSFLFFSSMSNVIMYLLQMKRDRRSTEYSSTVSQESAAV